jgi:hypothetical protein
MQKSGMRLEEHLLPRTARILTRKKIVSAKIYVEFYLLAYNAVWSVECQSDISEEHIVTIFRIKSETEQEPELQQVASGSAYPILQP